MKPFWRENDLTPDEDNLISLVSVAHYHATFRPNPSSVACQCAAQGSGTLFNSIAAAITCFGGPHGPIESTYAILAATKMKPEDVVSMHISRGAKVPGWGTSFKDQESKSSWNEIDAWIQTHEPDLHQRMSDITQALHESGRDIEPNPSAYTAAAAIALGMPMKVSPYLLLMGRLSAWTEIFMQELKAS